MAQPDSEGEQITQTIKVTERHNRKGRLFWREVLDINRYKGLPMSPWEARKKSEDRNNKRAT